ncbi:MAG: PRTRC system ThiF family protein [Thermodesulfovibrionales bacterium]
MQKVSPISSNFKHYLPADLVTSGNEAVEILLIGVGGNGGPMITGLARMDFALRALGHGGLNLRVMDKDIVGPENVGRQLFSPSDISRNKAECLVTRVNHFFGLRWKALPFDFEKHHVDEISKKGVDIVITAVDNVAARELVHKAVKNEPIYHLDMGNTKNVGQCILGTGDYIKQPKNLGDCIGHLPTVIDLYPNLRKEEAKSYQGPSCGIREAIERQDLLINTVVSTFALTLLWDAFRNGFLTQHGVFINLQTKRTSPLVINPAVWKGMGWDPAQCLTQRKSKPKKMPARKAA